MSALTVVNENGIAVVTFDLEGESVNKFSRAVKDEFITIFDRFENDESVKGVVLISGKPDGFIAGADIEEFLQIHTATDAERLSRDGQLMIDKVEALRVPVVAAIHGACMGGGLEAVLACHYRIATDHPKTILALPEVKLGLIPGAGGTQRLPQMIGVENALPMILEGKNIRAKKALQMGLVDEMVHPSILREIAIRRAGEIADGTRERSKGRAHAGARGTLLDGTSFGRSLVLRKARSMVLEKTHGHYPAPLAALDAVAYGYEHGRRAGLEEEARLFGKLATSAVSRELIFLFFATTALKKDPGTDEAAEAMPINKVAVVGAGFMGAGIATVVVENGTSVRMKDADHGRVGKGLASIREVIAEKLTKKQITRQQLDETMALVGGTTDYSGFSNVDLVVEAVFEDPSVKHQVLRESEQVIPTDAIFASNTSTIPIARIAEASARPDRVVGMHFFSPVHKMPLLEVIAGAETSPDVIASVVAFGKQIGKTVIVVNDAPGFYANRILSPYVNEAGKLLDDGAAIETVDKALVQFGFPVGPITLVDEVGIDVAGKVGNIIADAFGERMAPSRTLQQVVSAGRYGRKGKKGFYLYDAAGKKGGVDASVYDLFPTGQNRVEIPVEEIQQRTVLAMVNEAARCVEEGILRSPRDGDVGAVFGIGFPPFRGGPFRYIDAVGVGKIVEQLEELNERFPPRFRPAEILVQMARKKERFYPEDGPGH